MNRWAAGMDGREHRFMEIRASPSAQKPGSGRLPLVGSSTLRYALAELSVIVSLHLFQFVATAAAGLSPDVAIFVGLWASMFGIPGLRAEVMEIAR